MRSIEKLLIIIDQEEHYPINQNFQVYVSSLLIKPKMLYYFVLSKTVPS